MVWRTAMEVRVNEAGQYPLTSGIYDPDCLAQGAGLGDLNDPSSFNSDVGLALTRFIDQ
jgi:hypothetical protein